MRLTLALILLAIFQTTAHAYVGPGIGAGTIGIALGILVSIFLAIFAILWYPFKRLLKKIKDTKKKSVSRDNPSQQANQSITDTRK